MIQVIATDKAPKVIGPYSQAIKANGFVFLSGQIAVDPKSNTFIGGSIEEQTTQVLKNASHILHATGSSLDKVLKTTVFLKDMADYNVMNEIYGEYFPNNKPARSAVQVARLPKDALIEIEMVAIA